MNVLVLSAGSSCHLVKYFMEEDIWGKVVATDCSKYAPAMYLSDSCYRVPPITDSQYIPKILEICQREEVGMVLPLREDELELIAECRKVFQEQGILVAVSHIEGLRICRDKYLLYQHLRKCGIPCVRTIDPQEEREALESLSFPVIVKPRYGCGSIGLRQIGTREQLEAHEGDGESMVVQSCMEGEEYGVDAYVDFLSGEVVSIFAKKKISMRTGETEKSVSVLEEELFSLTKQTVKSLGLSGPVDIDIFQCGNHYEVLEVNPRFGGGYSHAHACGINFPKMLGENAAGRENPVDIGNYARGVVAMKYRDVVVKNEKDLL